MSQARRWGIGAAIAAVVILAAGWFLLVKPQKAKVTDLHTQTAAQNSTNAQLLTQITALQAEAKNNAQEQRLLEKFATQIPDSPAEPSLIRALSETAKGSGVDLLSITPGDAITVSGAASTGSQALNSAAAGGQLFSLPITLAVQGSYSNLESFFSGLEHLPRAYLTSAFTILPATAASGGADLRPNDLSVSISTAVFYSTPSAVPAPTGSAPGATTPAASADGSTNPAAPAVDVARHGAGETS